MRDSLLATHLLVARVCDCQQSSGIEVECEWLLELLLLMAVAVLVAAVAAAAWLVWATRDHA